MKTKEERNHLEELLKDSKAKFVRIDEDTKLHIYSDNKYFYYYELKAQYPKLKAMGYKEI